MDPRVATAPTPKGKRWVAKNNGASCLLRQPSGKSVTSTRSDVSTAADRPKTCPTPALTPQFHWNLNSSALKTLSRSQVEQLYGLFKFYDSSTSGDTLPSINCARLVEILRDARMLNDKSGLPSERKLQVEYVERIFAQAVMGKMRVYLDADGQPALPFPLFCGALMNCAMLLTPSAHPEAALRQILPILLEGSIVNGHHASASKGLLGHLPADGAISLWVPGQSIDPHVQTDALQDFLALSPFQQVIADCTRYKVLDELKQEKLARNYQIPTRLLASFHPDTIALISNKFRMFDVFDRGTLPRNEVFPLLSSLGKHADFPDPYAVLSRLSTSNGPPHGAEQVCNSGELTLVQLLQEMEATREAKRHSILARLGEMKINLPREDSNASSALATSMYQTEPSSSFEEAIMNEGSSNDRAGSSHAAAAQSHHGSIAASSLTIKDRGKRTGIARSRSRKSILSHGINSTTNSNSSHALLNTKHQYRCSPKSTLTHHASVSGKKKTEFHRKSSLKGNLKNDAAAGSNRSGNHSQRSATTICSYSTDSDEEHVVGVLDSLSSPIDDINNGCASHRLTDHDHGLLHESATIKTLRVFLLLGGDHDGAICSTISLVLGTRKIMESEGIYYSTAPSEITRTTPVLPTQNTLTNALLMLKKSVLTRVESGFKLRPTNQLDAVDNILHELQRNQPRFSIARSPTAKAFRDNAIAANSSPFGGINDDPGQKMPQQMQSNQNLVAIEVPGSSSSPDLLRDVSSTAGRVAPSSPIRRMARSKPTHLHQIKLPSNYRDLFATWEVSQGENCAWIHAVNATSPLRPACSQARSVRAGQLSPLPFGQEN